MKKKLVSFFKKNPGKALKARELAKQLEITEEHEYQSFKALLHQLLEEDLIVRLGKRFQLKIENAKVISGELQMHPRGFGFVLPKKEGNRDIFIAGRNLGTAFHGDIVEVALFAEQKKKAKNLEGEITKIIKRRITEVVGTFKKSDSLFYVEPEMKEMRRDIYIDEKNIHKAKVGDRVVVSEIVWESPKQNPEGKIIEVLAKTSKSNIELLSIAKEFNLPVNFPERVLQEAEEIALEIPAAEISTRVDYRNKVVMTIDPDDAKDFDDALSIEVLENGNFAVGVHIADVSHYVAKETSLDKESEKRGNSVYLVGKVIPMLPERLSNNICSLVPNEERLTYSVVAELTARGKLVDYKIKKTIIKSKRRFTYDEAQKIIETGEGDFSTEVLLLNKLALTLRKKRLKEGSVNFSTSEIKFELDEAGNPLRAYLYETKQSNNLVEEFMLLANKVVAHHIGFVKKESARKPFLYRIHDRPNKEKIEEFAKFIKSFGYHYSADNLSKASSLNQLMEEVKGKEEELLVNEIAIRSMAKAIYSTENIGHYGLGFPYYTHFTSPIRRYSDLLVHRLLFEYIEKHGKLIYSEEQLSAICENISACERKAVDAERLSVKLKQVELMQSHIGEEFHAIISGVTHFGIFVKIKDILAEGLVHVRDLEGDYYLYDEKKYALIGKASKKMFRLGDKIQVKLIRINQERMELDFLIIE
ncbi:MAG: ribonuclease R [Ignavibacteriaceae bacterium]|jgi:ribonuclease R|nr:ribonuclease R [Ignavibacteriaceae bacterium]